MLIGLLFWAFLRLSNTYPENSDEANILLMANDMLHGNVLLHGWSVSDVPFITTELPQIALLVWMFGLHLNTAHIAAALTYTLVVAMAMLLAKGKAHGWAAVARMALVLVIMSAPQPGVGIFVLVFSVGHIGTALPVMLTWFAIDRLGRKWWVAVLVALLIGWALTADPLVLVVAVLPLLAVCLARVVSAVVLGARQGGLPGMRAAALDRWFEVWLAAAAGIGYTIAWGAGQFITNHAGYKQQPVPYDFDWPRLWLQAQVVVHGLLEMFGAYFIPGVDHFIHFPLPQDPPGGLYQAVALTHLIGVVLAVWGACAIARRFFFRDADIVSQLLLAGIVANIAAYVPSTLAHHTALNVREIAPVLPFAAVLAGRMLGDRFVTGPVAAIKLPRFLSRARIRRARNPVPDVAQADGMPVSRRGQRRMLRLRLMSIPLVLVFSWFGYGLIAQAGIPAAPMPLTNVAAFLRAKGLNYGLGGYWEASVITVETGGAVTVRAITPACLQPYQWESKADWYDPAQHYANFILLSNTGGFFTKFAVRHQALKMLDAWSRPPFVNTHVPKFYHLPFQGWPANLTQGGTPVRPAYTASVYPLNLLSEMPALSEALSNPAVKCG